MKTIVSVLVAVSLGLSGCTSGNVKAAESHEARQVLMDRMALDNARLDVQNEELKIQIAKQQGKKYSLDALNAARARMTAADSAVNAHADLR